MRESWQLGLLLCSCTYGSLVHYFRYDRTLKEGTSFALSKGFVFGNGLGAVWLVIYMVLSTAFAYGIKLFKDGEPGLEPGSVLIVSYKSCDI